MVDKKEYLRNCSFILAEASRKVDYCFNGLLIEFAPSFAEQSTYIDLVKSLDDLRSKFDEVLNRYGKLNII